ncbi:hypothetical protein C8R46DRAFT_1353845 [Mycena filopes]|nr:hypothetical protein C8R46DRAFT_1353845 [Mycena filopes]
MESNVPKAQIEMYHKVLVKEWNRVKQNPSSRLALVRPPGGPQCNSCQQLVENVRVCSACKIVIYCSPKCAKAGWRSHKGVCSAAKRDGERIPKFKGVVAQFAFLDVGWNTGGDFILDFALMQFGLVGTSRKVVGYWATHERRQEAVDDVLDAPWSLLSEEEGWRLPAHCVPSLALESSENRPSFPPKFEGNWKSYYEWRRLPMSSPAAVLLHWPLAVYVCLKELGFVLGIPAEPRRKLKVFYLGARDELCILPVFGELALLFPNTDLDLVVFGQNTGRAVERAKSRGKTESARPCVFEYSAPTACGGGALRIFIDSAPGFYRPSRDPSDHPDAIVALNAGLGTYISWQPVILLSAEYGIPFAVTDYSEISLGKEMMEILCHGLDSSLPVPKGADEIRTQAIMKKVISEAEIDVDKVFTVLNNQPPVKFNELMQPSIRDTPSTRCPGARNACVQVVVPGRNDIAFKLASLNM